MGKMGDKIGDFNIVLIAETYDRLENAAFLQAVQGGQAQGPALGQKGGIGPFTPFDLQSFPFNK